MLGPGMNFLLLPPHTSYAHFVDFLPVLEVSSSRMGLWLWFNLLWKELGEGLDGGPPPCSGGAFKIRLLSLVPTWAMLQVGWCVTLYLACLGLNSDPNIWLTGLISGPVSSLWTCLGTTGLLAGSECHPQTHSVLLTWVLWDGASCHWGHCHSPLPTPLPCRTAHACCSLGLWYHACFICDAYLKTPNLNIT